MRFDKRLLAFPLLLFFLFALFQYVKIDVESVKAVGGVLFREATVPLPINAKITAEKIDFQSKAKSAFIQFVPSGSAVEIDSKPVKTTGEKSTLSVSGFEGSFSIYVNGTVIIDGSAESFVLGDITFSRSKVAGTLLSTKASFYGISSDMIDKKAKGTVAVGASRTDIDGKIRITSFRGNVLLSENAIELDGNASRVSIDSGFKANFS